MRVLTPGPGDIGTRDEEIAYALSKGIPVEATPEAPFSFDENLLGRAIEAGVLEDPWNSPPEEPFGLTSSPATAPASTTVVIGFEQGLPIALDGEELALADLIAELNAQ